MNNAMSELDKPIINPLTGSAYIQKPEKVKRKRMGRPKLNPGSERKSTICHLDKQTLLMADIVRTHSKSKRSIQSRSGLIERLIWDEAARLCPQYLKILKKPKL